MIVLLDFIAIMVKFTSPPYPLAFQNKVWDLVRRIPVGKVATYGQIAMLIPVPDGVEVDSYRAFGARWVGGAMRACPDDVPWHRVINAQGKISLPGASGGDLQRKLLEDEGILFDNRDRINLNIYSWSGLNEQSNN